MIINEKPIFVIYAQASYIYIYKHNCSSSNLFISKNTKDTLANYSSKYIVILSTNFGILQCQLERRLRSDRLRSSSQAAT